MQFDFFENRLGHDRRYRPSDRKHIVASISAGRSSAMMGWILKNDPIFKDYKIHFVFANTGRELPKTISFLKNLEQHVIKEKIHLIEAKVHHDERKSSTYTVKEFDTLSMNGEPFKEVIKKYGLPSIETPHCSRELKVNPIKSFIQEGLGLERWEFRQAIGIRIDEARRIKHDYEGFVYPLADLMINKLAVMRFWNQPEFSPYDIGVDYEDGFEDFEGNCDLCFKKSWMKLIKMKNKYPERLEWWKNVESEFDEGYPIYRENMTVSDLENEKKVETKDLECLCGHSETFFD